MKAVFTAAALLATLAVPAAFAGTRDNPHPMKDASGATTTPAKTTTKTPAKTSGKAAPAATTPAHSSKPAAKTN